MSTTEPAIRCYRNSILVKFPYDPSKVEQIKSIARKWDAKKCFDPETKEWKLPKQAALELSNLFPALEWDREFARLATKQQRESERRQDLLEAIQKEAVRVKYAVLPNGKKLYAHQVEGIDFLLREFKCILADDMGVGKTLQALVAGNYIANAATPATGGRIIVITKAGLVRDWYREAQSLNIEIRAFSWAKIPKPAWSDFVLICDEAHYAQNMQAKRTQAMLELAQEALAVFHLTGTPMKNAKPANLFPLLRSIEHPLGRNKADYEVRYCGGRLKEMRVRGKQIKFWDASGAEHLDELHEKTKGVILRRLKTECLDLPKKTRIVRQIEVSQKAFETYESEFKKAFNFYKFKVESGEIGSWEDGKGVVHGDGEALVILSCIRQAASEGKIEAAIELTEEALDEGSQIIVFTEFIETARKVANHFRVQPYMGGVYAEQKDKIVQDFQAGRTKVFVTTRAGGEGLNLTAANVVILIDRPLTPGDAEQIEDRAYRIGQHWPVTVYWLQGFPVDEKIDALLFHKIKVIAAMLTGEKATMRGGGAIKAQQVLKGLFDENQSKSERKYDRETKSKTEYQET